MLENIKSKYLFKKLFSNVEEIIKLKIAKYNKRLQNIVDVDLINYKTFTNKYIIYEENGKGKEYQYVDDLECLIFEGEYLNGNRNGKGKEYYYGILIFEGKYSNGKRNGKGKEYDNDGNLIFEGEYLFNKKWNGKGFDKNGNIIFELKEGKGYIKEFNLNQFGLKSNLNFEGEYLNGEINGKGRENYFNNILRFEGEYLNSKKNGKIKQYFKGK